MLSTESDPDAADMAELVKLLTCPDCPCKILRGLTSGGEVVVVVEHDPTCPQIPPEQKAQGNTAMRFDSPRLITIDVGEESTDDQQE